MEIGCRLLAAGIYFSFLFVPRSSRAWMLAGKILRCTLRRRRTIKFLLKYFLVMSVICLILGFGLGVRQILFLHKAIPADGTVIEMITELPSQSGRHSNKSYMYYPKVEFATPDGKKAQFKSDLGASPVGSLL
jgi:hypothetical protein